MSSVAATAETCKPPPTSGASSGAMLHENIQKIFEYHDACEQLSHLHEKPVHINPANPEEYFVITMIKADAYGKLLYQLILCIVTKFLNDLLNTPSKPIPKRLLQLPLQNHSNTTLAQLEGIKAMMMTIQVIPLVPNPCLQVRPMIYGVERKTD
ncbi:hypothetical protein VP01_4515g1 [Puccinia sorghi]|uniref:Uncharacterized protein n=1 Tax=Puccinia sorghi TaxID=27349 RepID=A0A0L6UPU4_9BASI|nr:hypothetical protein VP01_4515g1 [Puccinia sorghi]